MFDSATIWWSLLFGSIGTGYFIYGKKERRGVPLACGLVLIIFPWFVPSTLWTIVIGALVTAIPYFIRL